MRALRLLMLLGVLLSIGSVAAVSLARGIGLTSDGDRLRLTQRSMPVWINHDRGVWAVAEPRERRPGDDRKRVDGLAGRASVRVCVRVGIGPCVDRLIARVSVGTPLVRWTRAPPAWSR